MNMSDPTADQIFNFLPHAAHLAAQKLRNYQQQVAKHLLRQAAKHDWPCDDLSLDQMESPQSMLDAVVDALGLPFRVVVDARGFQLKHFEYGLARARDLEMRYLEEYRAQDLQDSRGLGLIFPIPSFARFFILHNCPSIHMPNGWIASFGPEKIACAMETVSNYFVWASRLRKAE